MSVMHCWVWVLALRQQCCPQRWQLRFIASRVNCWHHLTYTSAHARLLNQAVLHSRVWSPAASTASTRQSSSQHHDSARSRRRATRRTARWVTSGGKPRTSNLITHKLQRARASQSRRVAWRTRLSACPQNWGMEGPGCGCSQYSIINGRARTRDGVKVMQMFLIEIETYILP